MLRQLSSRTHPADTKPYMSSNGRGNYYLDSDDSFKGIHMAKCIKFFSIDMWFIIRHLHLKLYHFLLVLGKESGFHMC